MENRRRVNLKDLKSGANKLGDSGNSADEPPHWYDHEQFCRGQQFFQRHVSAIGFSMHLSLLSGFSIINLLEPLVFTKASDTAEKSIKRYLMTFYHIFLWMTCDIWDKDSKAYKSLKTVKGMHNKTSSAMRKQYKDKIYVSQYDMALVQSGFFAATLMYPTQFGIGCSIKELEDYVFTWRVIGYKLGIEDQYNICSCDKYEDTYNLCKEIETECLWPALKNPPKHFDSLADAYIDGVNSIIPIKLHSKASALALVYDGFGQEGIPYPMSIFDWARFYFWKINFFLTYYLPFLERIMNKRILDNFVVHMEKLFDKRV